MKEVFSDGSIARLFEVPARWTLNYEVGKMYFNGKILHTT